MDRKTYPGALDYLYSLLWTGKLAGRKVNGKWRVLERSVAERLQKLEARHGN